MAVNVNNTQNICNVSQFNEAQALMDFICPKLCAIILMIIYY